MKTPLPLTLALVLVLGAGCGTPPPNEQAQGPKQKPIPVLQGSFQLVPGTWAVYDLHDVQKNSDSRMHFALAERVKQGKVPAMWIEVEVQQAGQPTVVTRFLAEESAEGFGRMFEAIVQVEGYEPFRIPKSFLEQGKDEAPKFQTLTRPGATAASTTLGSPNAPPKIPMVVNGRPLHVFQVEANDDQHRPVRVVVTEEVPPLAIVSAETADLTMRLVDWGKGTATKIKGKPLNFYWWIAKQAGKALSEGDKTPAAKP